MPNALDVPSLPMRYSGEAPLRASFAASLVVHVVAFGALAVVTGGFDRGMTAHASAAAPYLEVALVSPRIAAVQPSVAPTLVTAPSAPVTIATAPEPALRPLPEPPMAIAPPRPNSGDGSGGVGPSASVTDRFLAARFGDFLDGERLAGFPREVDAPVRLPGKLEVPYPPAALAAREEGTIRVFAVIAEDGSVERTDLQFDQPSPELGKAVDALLMQTRFIPAEDGGKPIRFYVTLEFAFRLEGADGAKAAGGDPTAPAQQVP